MGVAMDGLETVSIEGQVVAMKSSGRTFDDKGVTFFTPGDYSQQVAYMRHPEGHEIAAPQVSPAQASDLSDPVANEMILNIAGGTEVSVNDPIRKVDEIAGVETIVRHLESHPGDVGRTGADTSLAAAVLGWRPRVSLSDGQTSQIEWHYRLLSDS